MVSRPLLLLSDIKQIFTPALIYFDVGTKQERVNLEVLVEGVEMIVDKYSAAITYPTAVAMSIALYQNRPQKKEKLRKMFLKGRMALFEDAGMEYLHILTALHKSFELEGTVQVKIPPSFTARGMLKNSYVLYKDERKMLDYLEGNFEIVQERPNQTIKLCRPTFSMQGF